MSFAKPLASTQSTNPQIAHTFDAIQSSPTWQSISQAYAPIQNALKTYGIGGGQSPLGLIQQQLQPTGTPSAGQGWQSPVFGLPFGGQSSVQQPSQPFGLDSSVTGGFINPWGQRK